MPTVLRFNGFRVVVYPNDHRPAHVHVIGKDREAVFHLNCPDGPIELRESYNTRRSFLKRFEQELMRNVIELCREWENIHGIGYTV